MNKQENLERNRSAGDQGEYYILSLISRIFNANVKKLEGISDKGIDLLVQFANPLNKAELYYLGIQVKTGKSYVESVGKSWKLKNVDYSRFNFLLKSSMSIMIVWLEETASTLIPYWTLLTREISKDYLFISKQSILSPAAIYDFIIKYKILDTSKTFDNLKYNRLTPPLNKLIRDFAKQYYKHNYLSKKFTNKELGEVNFSWSGWRHITRVKRKSKYIYESLEMLPMLKKIVTDSKISDFRRLKRIRRGNIIIETRLIILEKQAQNRRLILVLREQIDYPINWVYNLKIFFELKRTVTFESIYLK